MEKLRVGMRYRQAVGYQGTSGRALALGQFAVHFNDPNLINTQTEMFQRVSREDIRRVAATYFKPQARTVVITMPKAAGANGGGN